MGFVSKYCLKTNRIPVLFFVLFTMPCIAQNTPRYKNAALPVETRVQDLLSRMTTEEKFWQLFMISEDFGGDTDKYSNGIFGFQLNAAANTADAAQQMMQYDATADIDRTVQKVNAIQRHFVAHTRLGIPVIIFNEALHGLIAKGATAYPQSIALAATFDTVLMHKVAQSIASETKKLGVRQILGPVINVATDVRWGRTEETYGEDPLLNAAMGVAYVRAFEQMGIITTPKHFIANVADGGRDSYPVHLDERTLEQIYYPPFLACIREGGARSIMSSYNSLNGIPCSMNSDLLLKKLKQEWGFKGFVISDAGAVGGANVLHYTSPDYATSGKQAIDNGLDVIFQTAWEHYKLFIPHFSDGTVNMKRIDDAVARVLRAKFELGLFEHPYVSQPTEHKTADPKLLAKQAALESIVLLKNEHNILPLGNNVHTIAVIGADAIEARLGGYSGPGNNKVSILQGLREAAGDKTILYTAGCGRGNKDWVVVPDSVLKTAEGNAGVDAEYFNNITLSGKPDVVRKERAVNFQWTFSSPDEKIKADFFSARWSAKLTAPVSGNVKIGLDGNDGFRLYINNHLMIDNWQKQTYSTKLADYHFVQGQQYDIRVEFFEPVGNSSIRLVWNAGIENNWKEEIDEAVNTAKKADVAIVVAGIEEGEFRDRAYLSLPGHQEELIQRIAATGVPVIVTLVGGSAVTMNNWIGKVPAILDVWYPGEEGGHAFADIILGKVSPSGKLPVTFPLTEGQLPLVYNHEPTGRGDDYNNSSGLPLFPFGYGLSYTTFEYNDLDLGHSGPGDTIVVKCTLKNTGATAGDEVVQLYIRNMLAQEVKPVMELKGFQRVHLLAGESRRIIFHLAPGVIQATSGTLSIMLGSSSRDIRLKNTLITKQATR